MSNYHIRKLEPGEFHLLIPLMKDCFGMDVNIDYFQWKFLDNPAGNFEGFVALSEHDEVAAYYGVIPEIYDINNTRKTIFQSGDTMTHSSHRRKGLFYKTATHCYDFLRENKSLFVIGFGGRDSTPGLEKLQWRHLFRVSFFFKTYYACKLKKILGLAQAAKEYNINENCDVEDIAKLKNQNRQAQGVLKYFSPELFKWKLANPLYNFKKIGIYDNQKLQAYVIYCVQNNKILICDFAESPPRSTALKLLFRFIDYAVATNKYKGVFSFTNDDSDFAKTLTDNGFVVNNINAGPLKEKIPFMVLTDEYNYTVVNKPTLWNINPLYHDSF